VSRQTIVAVAITLAVVTLNSYGRTALAARPIAVALTNQAEKAQAFDALAKLVRPIILLYPCLGLFPAMYFAASETDHRKLYP
jgi:hypothetical protein